MSEFKSLLMTNGKILAIGGIFTIAFAAYLFWPAKADTQVIASDTVEKVEVVMYKNATCMCCAKWEIGRAHV